MNRIDALLEELLYEHRATCDTTRENCPTEDSVEAARQTVMALVEMYRAAKGAEAAIGWLYCVSKEPIHEDVHAVCLAFEAAIAKVEAFDSASSPTTDETTQPCERCGGQGTVKGKWLQGAARWSYRECPVCHSGKQPTPTPTEKAEDRG